jgi:hypothetical protein
VTCVQGVLREEQRHLRGSPADTHTAPHRLRATHLLGDGQAHAACLVHCIVCGRARATALGRHLRCVDLAAGLLLRAQCTCMHACTQSETVQSAHTQQEGTGSHELDAQPQWIRAASQRTTTPAGNRSPAIGTSVNSSTTPSVLKTQACRRELCCVVPSSTAPHLPLPERTQTLSTHAERGRPWHQQAPAPTWSWWQRT